MEQSLRPAASRRLVDEAHLVEVRIALFPHASKDKHRGSRERGERTAYIRGFVGGPEGTDEEKGRR